MKKFGFLNINRSIQNRIFIYFIIVITISTSVLSFSLYYSTIEMLKSKVSDSFSQTLEYIGYSIEKELKQIKQISDFIFINSDIKELLVKKYKNQGERLADIYKVDEVFSNYSIANVFSYIPSIKILGNNGEEISFGNEAYEVDSNKIKELWLEKSNIGNDGKILWSGIHKNYITLPFEDKYVISLLRIIMSENYTEDIGVMYISLEPEIFGNMLGKVKLKNGCEIFIVDNNNRIVYHNDKGLLAGDINKVIDASDKLVACHNIDAFGWKVYGTIPLSIFKEEANAVIHITIIAFFLSFILTCIIWHFILSRIVRPVKNLANTMKSVGEDKILVKFEYKGQDEIGILGQNFNHMIERINNLFNSLLMEQYNVLQAQINPHFLFNTLNSIRWMAIIQKADNIKEVLDVLSRLLLNSTKNIRQFITLEEELNNLKDYIYIEKLRYNDAFDVIFEVQEDILKHYCVKFILQPLVENAIFHGIEPKKGIGVIRITINKGSENTICFQVKDNGVGMTQEQISTVLHLVKEKTRGLCGIGIKNVDDRIKMTYGSKYGISIESRIGEYTAVTVSIPADEKGELPPGHKYQSVLTAGEGVDCV